MRVEIEVTPERGPIVNVPATGAGFSSMTSVSDCSVRLSSGEKLTRIRVNTYSYVRLVAELSDGKLYGVKTFVKASGGCSAPASSNSDATKSMIGQMKFRTFRPESGALPEAQFMMRHPQNSGLQMDQLTRLYIPPFFIENLKIWQGDALLVEMEGGIAISEDPNIRFNFKPNGADKFRVEAMDTNRKLFRDEWPLEKSVL